MTGFRPFRFRFGSSLAALASCLILILSFQNCARPLDKSDVTVPSASAFQLSSPKKILDPGESLTLTVSNGTAPYSYEVIQGQGVVGPGSGIYQAPSVWDKSVVLATDSRGQQSALEITTAVYPDDFQKTKFWLQANSLGLVQDQFVYQWNDEISGNNAVQNNLGASPTFHESGINAQPGVYFDGNDFLTSNYRPPTGNANRTFAVVLSNIELQQDRNYNHVFHYGTNSANLSYGLCVWCQNSQMFGNHVWGSRLDLGSYILADPQVVIMDYDSTGRHRLFSNGLLLNTSARTLATGTAYRLHIGKRIPPTTIPEEFKGLLYEFMAFDDVLSDEERQSITDYLQDKYGL